MIRAFNRKKKIEEERRLAKKSVEIYFQLFLLALNRSFRFGKKRLTILLATIKELEQQFLEDAKNCEKDRNFSTVEYSKSVLDKEISKILGEEIKFE